MNLPATRLNPDSRPMILAAVVLTLLLGVVSFALSFAALAATAEWAAIPPALAWALPVMVDGAMIVYTIAALVYRARGESTRSAWVALALFTGVSVLANAAHAVEAGTPGDPKTVLGTALAGLAPIAVLFATHTIARLVVAPPSASVAGAAGTAGTAVVDDEADVAQALAIVAPAPRALAEVRSLPPRRRPRRTPSEVEARREEILALGAEGLTVRAIAERVGVSKSTAARVLATSSEVTA